MNQSAHKNVILLSVIAILLTWTACSSKSTRTVYKAGYDYRYARAPAYSHYPQRYRYYQRYSRHSAANIQEYNFLTNF